MKVSIVCLIYKSVNYLDFILSQIKKYTPREDYHEFFFVANDATEKVIDHLDVYYIPHEILPAIENCKHYIQQVYAGWNFAVEKANGDVVVLINSDMGLSKDWLKNILKHLKSDNAISSRLLESGRMPSGKYGITFEFGMSPQEYDEGKFQKTVEILKIDKVKEGGLYSPIAFYKETFLKGGGYPHGNLVINNVQVSGDVLFWSIMKTKGVEHYTSFDSIVYHFQEGEMRE